MISSRGSGALLTAAGIGISLISLAAIVWWAAHQEPPNLPVPGTTDPIRDS